MPSTVGGPSNLDKYFRQNQHGSNEALTFIPQSNLAYGKHGREEGIFIKKGEDYLLIRGKRFLKGSLYYYVGSERIRGDSTIIDLTTPKEFKLYENDKIVYKGRMKNGVYHGHGTIFKDGKPVFEGQFENGKKCGEGCEFDENGLFVKRIYKDDRVCGTITEDEDYKTKIDEYNSKLPKNNPELEVVDTSSCDFIVQRKRDTRFQEFPRTFYGYISKKGIRVIGKEYKDNGCDHFLGIYDKNGKYRNGTLWCNSDIWFKGSFEDGKMKHGKIYLLDILLYEGDVNEAGQMHGEGTLYYTSKMRTKPVLQYKGLFKNGKPDGFGKVYYAPEDGAESKIKYCGYFKNGLFNGRGIYFSKDLSYCCGSSLELGKTKSASKEKRNEKSEPMDIMKACKDINKEDFDSLLCKYEDGKLEGGWKEGELDGYIKIVFANLSSCLVKMCNRKPTYVWDLKIDGKIFSGSVKVDDKSNIPLLYFKITFTEYTVKFDDWVYELKQDDAGQLAGSIYYKKMLLYRGSIKDYEPDGNGELFNEDSERYAEGTFANGTILSCKTKTDKYLYEFTPINWDWRKPKDHKLDGKGKMYRLPEPSELSGNEEEAGRYYLVYDGDIANGIFEGEGKLYYGNPTYRQIERCYSYDSIKAGQFKKGEIYCTQFRCIIDRSKAKPGYTAQKISYFSSEKYILYMDINEESNAIQYDRFVFKDSNEGWFVEGGCTIMYGKKDGNGKKDGVCYFYLIRNQTRMKGIFEQRVVKHNEKELKSFLIKKETYKSDILEGDVCYYVDGNEISMQIMNNEGVQCENGKTTIRNAHSTVKKSNDVIYQGSIVLTYHENGNMNYIYDGQGWGRVVINNESNCSFEGEWHKSKISKGQLRFNDERVIEGEWKDGEVDPSYEYTIKLKGDDYKKCTLYKNYKEHNMSECSINGKVYRFEKKGIKVQCTVSTKDGSLLLYQGYVYSKADYNHIYADVEKRSIQRSILATRFKDWEYIPYGEGQEYQNGTIKFIGNYKWGNRQGEGIEYGPDDQTIIFVGSWKNDYYECGVYYYHDLKILCFFGTGSQVQNAQVYKNELPLYQGSISFTQNKIEPIDGTWYINCCGTSLSVKSSELKKGIINIKTPSLEYKGSVKLEDFNFHMSIYGNGELTYNGFVYSGQFEGTDIIKGSTISRLGSFGKKTTIFYGEVISLEMYAGILFDQTKIQEGLFKDKQLTNGYVFNSNGTIVKSIGDTQAYESIYTKKKYTYREIFQENHKITLHYSVETYPTASVANLTSNSTTTTTTHPISATYVEMEKLANGSLQVYQENGKKWIKLI